MGAPRSRAGSPPSLSSGFNPSPIAHAADQPASAANVAPFMLVASSTTPQDSSNQGLRRIQGTPARRDPRVGASPGAREPALGLAADRRCSDGPGVTVSPTPQPRAQLGVRQ